MRFRAPGRFRSVGDFRRRLRELDPASDADADVAGAGGPLGQPLTAGRLAIGNRFAVHPMEGWDGTPDGLPTEHTVRRWRRFGLSGAKLVWGGEAFAVRRDGRANPRQLFLNPGRDVARGLAELLAATREAHRESAGSCDGLCVGLQLTHSGRWSRPDGAAAPRAAFRHPVLDARTGVPPVVVTDAWLDGLGESYVRAAELARSVGFDFIDVKCCHGYLVHELLAAREREGSYGGSFEGRTRFVRRVVEAIRAACPDLEVAARVSVADVFPHAADPASGVGAPLGLDEHVPYRHGFGVDPADPLSFDLEEPLRLLGLLEDLGVRLVNVTLGSPYYCPHLQRPAAYPPCDGYLPPHDPLADVVRHLRATRACKAAHPGLTLVGTGYSYLQEHLPHVAQREVRQGFVDAVGVGRMVLAYPELPRDVLDARPLARKRICRTFSDCTTAPRNGLPSGCYPLDAYYRALPEAARLKAAKAGGGPGR